MATGADHEAGTCKAIPCLLQGWCQSSAVTPAFPACGNDGLIQALTGVVGAGRMLGSEGMLRGWRWCPSQAGPWSTKHVQLVVVWKPSLQQTHLVGGVMGSALAHVLIWGLSYGVLWVSHK